MRMRPAYFAVTEPFRVFVATGTSESNTFVGRSQAIDTRHEARNAKPGSIVHSLPGGTFLQEPDGTLHAVRLRAPKHVFENSYGGSMSDDRRLDGMLAAGRLGPADEPAEADYAGARERAGIRLAPLTGGVVVVEESAEMSVFKADMAELANALEWDGATVTYADIHEQDAVRMRVAYPERKGDATVSRSAIDGKTWAHGALPADSCYASGFAGLCAKGGMTPAGFSDWVAGIVGEPTSPRP